MFWGKRAYSRGVSPDGTLSGHVHDWQELAVDYVDGLLDNSAKAAVQTHLEQCLECRERIQSQERVFQTMRQVSPAEAPAGLEDQVLSEVLFPRESIQVPRRSWLRRMSRDSHTWWSTLRPWIPAAAAVVIILAVVVTIGAVRQRGDREGALSADGATVTAFGGASAEETATLLTASTTAPALETAGIESAGDTTGDGIAEYMLSGAAPRTDDTNAADMRSMVQSLASADGPAYFSFGVHDESSITPQQVDAITQQMTALTGLGPMDQTFSSGTRAFAAFISKDDAQAVVDLLFSICVSLDLTVSMTMHPGQTISRWAESLLENKYAVAELDASPSEPPATTDWTYTTATAPTTTAGASSTTAVAPTSTTATAPTTTAAAATTTTAAAATTTAVGPTTTTVSLPAQIQTHVLVVILVGR